MALQQLECPRLRAVVQRVEDLPVLGEDLLRQQFRVAIFDGVLLAAKRVAHRPQLRRPEPGYGEALDVWLVLTGSPMPEFVFEIVSSGGLWPKLLADGYINA